MALDGLLRKDVDDCSFHNRVPGADRWTTSKG